MRVYGVNLGFRDTRGLVATHLETLTLAIKSEDIYRCFLQNSADGLIVSDANGLITTTNPAFQKLIGMSEKDLHGLKLGTVIEMDAGHNESVHQPPSSSGKLKSTESGGTVDLKSFANVKVDFAVPRQSTILCRRGMALSMLASQIPIETSDTNGDSSGLLTIIYIIQAQSVQQAQTEFVSTVSHEFRTPLTSIKGFADTILRAGDRLDLSQQRRYVGIIKDQADRLTRLVEDLLAVSRLESKKMQLTIRAMDLNEAVLRVQRNLADKARNHKIVNVIPSGLPQVWADADRLEQILTNLTDNAVKYSPPKTTVTVTARGIEGPPEMVEFAISDEGVGIPEDRQAEIFTKFSRLDNPLVRQTEGTGLGLYITRSLVLALGGQIKVMSSPGNTTFTVQLPAATLEEQAARSRG
jgi:signal transduction histidine kinase